jgi:hypothetical protein
MHPKRRTRTCIQALPEFKNQTRIKRPISLILEKERMIPVVPVMSYGVLNVAVTIQSLGSLGVYGWVIKTGAVPKRTAPEY